MSNICGQCGKPFSGECQLTFRCTLHNGQCYSCKPCKTQKLYNYGQYGMCFICKKSCPINDFYFCYKCNKFTCSQHLVKINFSQKQIKLPCSCSEFTEHVAAFMANFCNLCGRKIGDGKNKEIEICAPCERKNSQKKRMDIYQRYKHSIFSNFSGAENQRKRNQEKIIEKVIVIQEPLIKIENRQHFGTLTSLRLLKQNLQNIIVQSQLEIRQKQLQQNKNESSEHLKIQIQNKSNESNKLTTQLKQVQQELKLTKTNAEADRKKNRQNENDLNLRLNYKEKELEKYRVRQENLKAEVAEARSKTKQNQKQLEANSKQMKQIQQEKQTIRQILFKKDRDFDCPVCAQPYNQTTHQPMMICLRQHLMCEPCTKQSNITLCPLCRVKIVKQQIQVSRQRCKSLELETLLKRQQKDAQQESSVPEIKGAKRANKDAQKIEKKPQKRYQMRKRERKTYYQWNNSSQNYSSFSSDSCKFCENQSQERQNYASRKKRRGRPKKYSSPPSNFQRIHRKRSRSSSSSTRSKKQSRTKFRQDQIKKQSIAPQKESHQNLPNQAERSAQSSSKQNEQLYSSIEPQLSYWRNKYLQHMVAPFSLYAQSENQKQTNQQKENKKESQINSSISPFRANKRLLPQWSNEDSSKYQNIRKRTKQQKKRQQQKQLQARSQRKEQQFQNVFASL